MCLYYLYEKKKKKKWYVYIHTHIFKEKINYSFSRYRKAYLTGNEKKMLALPQ